jgi:hypothetical protein
VYPNPSNFGNGITIQTPEGVVDYSIGVYNMLGKLVSSTNYSINTTQIDSRDLSAGNYLVVFKTSTLTQRN